MVQWCKVTMVTVLVTMCEVGKKNDSASGDRGHRVTLAVVTLTTVAI
jgi:hypothetical protein